MIANHIHDALAQVGKLQQFILERNRFKGYSGKARIISGVVALAGAAVMSSAPYPGTEHAHLVGWASVLLVGLLVNYSALIYWFLFDRDVRRNPVMLKPALDAIPPLAVGGILAFSLVLRGQYDMIFGACLSLYGLAQVAYRRSLPAGIYTLGFFYLACGALFLVNGGMAFTNPWPMASAFAIGEIASGAVLIQHHRRDRKDAHVCPVHQSENLSRSLLCKGLRYEYDAISLRRQAREDVRHLIG